MTTITDSRKRHSNRTKENLGTALNVSNDSEYHAYECANHQWYNDERGFKR